MLQILTNMGPVSLMNYDCVTLKDQLCIVGPSGSRGLFSAFFVLQCSCNQMIAFPYIILKLHIHYDKLVHTVYSYQLHAQFLYFVVNEMSLFTMIKHAGVLVVESKSCVG